MCERNRHTGKRGRFPLKAVKQIEMAAVEKMEQHDTMNPVNLVWKMAVIWNVKSEITDY